ncbi:unnamed protein product [Rhodiola kirilowii]
MTNFINIPHMEGSEDRLLPIANVGRIMKQALPQNAKISKGTKERMQECATEFISFVTSEAADRCRKDNRKTLNGEDICRAMTALGLVNLGESTTRYLHKFREFESEKQQLNIQLQNEDPILVPESRDQYHEDLTMSLGFNNN